MAAAARAFDLVDIVQTSDITVTLAYDTLASAMEQADKAIAHLDAMMIRFRMDKPVTATEGQESTERGLFAKKDTKPSVSDFAYQSDTPETAKREETALLELYYAYGQVRGLAEPPPPTDPLGSETKPKSNFLSR